MNNPMPEAIQAPEDVRDLARKLAPLYILRRRMETDSDRRECRDLGYLDQVNDLIHTFESEHVTLSGFYMNAGYPNTEERLERLYGADLLRVYEDGIVSTIMEGLTHA
ncbi:MAG: hypothetical protein JSV86_13065 [Gemmatimonadota bacterium]|nr:MAG: hypothetical protein JSV86_13065 [Gemmatimonadota bacterium]